MESPLEGPLLELGIETPAIYRMLRQFPPSLLSEWLDITLAAKERFGLGFFKRSPAAFFVDNVTQAQAGKRTPPDWWYEVRKAEERARAERGRNKRSASREPPILSTESSQVYERIRNDMFGHFLAAGQSEKDAKRNAERFAHERVRRQERGAQ
jgi:hypothetical protein